jgi:hypothetical protein
VALVKLSLSNLAITDMDDFNAIEEIGYFLAIEGNDNLVAISGLTNLEAIYNTVPDSTEWFDDESSEVIIRYNDALVDIDGFETLTTLAADWMTISYNDSLSDISGFANLTTASADIEFTNNGALTAVSGFDALTEVDGYLSFSNNDALVDIDGFNALETGGPWIQNESSLVTVTGFASLTTITANGFLIQYNPALESFPGFAGVTTALGQIGIVSNAALLDLDGLAGVDTVTSTQVRLNSSLCQSIVDAYVAGITYDSLGTVTGNLDGC